MIIITQSKPSGVKMSIKTEVSEYFENLINSFENLKMRIFQNSSKI